VRLLPREQRNARAAQRVDKLQHPLLKSGGMIDRVAQPSDALEQLFARHLVRDDIRAPGRGGDLRSLLDQPAGLRQPGMKRRCCGRHQRTEAEDRHRRRHGEIVLPPENVDLVIVEPDDHPAIDRNAVVDDPLDLLEQIPFQVLTLLGFT